MKVTRGGPWRGPGTKQLTACNAPSGRRERRRKTGEEKAKTDKRRETRDERREKRTTVIGLGEMSRWVPLFSRYHCSSRHVSVLSLPSLGLWAKEDTSGRKQADYDGPAISCHTLPVHLIQIVVALAKRGCPLSVCTRHTACSSR